MPNGISGSFSSAKVDFMVDMGNPFLNLAVDGFLKIGAVGAAKVAAEETYDILIREGSISSKKFEHSLKRMCKEGACWVTIYRSSSCSLCWNGIWSRKNTWNQRLEERDDQWCIDWGTHVGSQQQEQRQDRDGCHSWRCRCNCCRVPQLFNMKRGYFLWNVGLSVSFYLDSFVPPIKPCTMTTATLILKLFSLCCHDLRIRGFVEDELLEAKTN